MKTDARKPLRGKGAVSHPKTAALKRAAKCLGASIVDVPMAANEPPRRSLGEALAPSRVPGFSPLMYGVISAFVPEIRRAILDRMAAVPFQYAQIAPHLYTSFAVTSDGFVIAQPGRRESGDFIGGVGDFYRNIARYIVDAGLTERECIEFGHDMRNRVQERPETDAAHELFHAVHNIKQAERGN